MTHSSDKPSFPDFGSDRTEAKVHMLTAEEIVQLRQDMAESSTWAKAELKRRRAAKKQKNYVHGIDDGIDNDHLSNWLLCRYIFFSLMLEWE